MRKFVGVACLFPLALATAAFAQTGYTISGALSNFDCSNHCDTECDEMEIELEGAQPSDIVHTYTNSNYGAPTVTLSPDGTSTIVDYRNPHHPTSVNSIEHFGVSIRSAYYYGPPAVYYRTHVRWYHNGHPATVNGQVPNPDGGTTNATQPMLPSISASATAGSHGTGGVTLTITNNDPQQLIWVKRRAIVTAGLVTLEQLMPTDPVVTSTIPIDNAPIPLQPLQSLTIAHDLIEFSEDQSAVFAAQYYQNLPNADPFSPDTPGPELGNIMTAAQANPQDLGCPHGPPTVVTPPADTTQDQGTRVDLRVQAHGDDVTPLTYVWLKDGVELTDGNGISGATSNHLRIDSLQPANEGFYSVKMTNFCATKFSPSALVFITGHNLAPVHACPADLDNGSGAGNPDGAVDINDLLFYVTVFEAGTAAADLSNVAGDASPDGGVDISDLLFFLTRFESGC